jgi:hypothetical protein
MLRHLHPLDQRFRAGLQERRMLFVHHVQPQFIGARHVRTRQRHGQIDEFTGEYAGMKQARFALGDATIPIVR